MENIKSFAENIKSFASVLSKLENKDEHDIEFDTFSVNIRRDDVTRRGMTFYAFYSISFVTSKGKRISRNIVDIKVSEVEGVEFKTSGTIHEDGKPAVFKYIDVLEHSKIFIKGAEKVLNDEYLEREFG